jgi:hypothetical protein
MGMETSSITPSTPITSRADRGDERVRLIEEAVLLIRGEWPAVASGLCESVNRAAGIFSFRASELQDAIQSTYEEAMRVVDRLYGHDATLEVQRLALAQPPACSRSASSSMRLSRV